MTPSTDGSRVLLVSATPGVSEHYGRLLVAAGVGVETTTSVDVAFALALRDRPDLVVVGADLGPHGGLSLAEQLWAAAPEVGCVLAIDSDGVEMEQRTLRAGGIGVLRLDTAADDLAAALAAVEHRRQLLGNAAASSARSAQVTSTRGRLVAVTSAKGAVGRSFVAANLASLLASTQPTILCDLDVQFADVSWWGSKQAPERTMDHLFALVRTGELRPEDLQSVIQPRFGGVAVLPGPRTPTDGLQWVREEGLVVRLLGTLARWYPWIIADLPAGLTAPGPDVLRIADQILVVTSAEIGALRATRRYLGHLDETAPSPRLVIVDRADRGEPMRLVREALGERESISYVRDDSGLARSLVLDGQAPSKRRISRAAKTLGEIAVAMRRSLQPQR